MAATKLTDKLTNIADAIREKTGGTDALTLDGMAAAIAGISAGGGGGVFYETFTPEADMNSSSLITLTHGLGAYPDFVILAQLSGETDTVETGQVFMSAAIRTKNDDETDISYGGVCAFRKSAYEHNSKAGHTTALKIDGAINVKNYPGPLGYATDEVMSITSCISNSTPKLRAGTTYQVVAGLCQ